MFSHPRFSTPQRTPCCLKQRGETGAPVESETKSFLFRVWSQSPLVRITAFFSEGRYACGICKAGTEKLKFHDWRNRRIIKFFAYIFLTVYIFAYIFSFKTGLPMYHPLTAPAAPFYLKKLYLLCKANLVIPNLCIEHEILVFYDSAFLCWTFKLHNTHTFSI